MANRPHASLTMVYAHNSLTQNYAKICGWKNLSTTTALNFETVYGGGTAIYTNSKSNTSTIVSRSVAANDLDTHIYTATWKDGVLTLYKDGVATTPITHPSGVLLYANGWRFEVGGAMASSGQMDGFLEHVHVNNYALAEETVVELHNSLLAELI